MTNYIRTNTFTQIATPGGTTLTWQSTIHVGDQPIYGSERIGVYKNNAIIKSNYNYDNVNNYNPYYASQLSNYRQLCYRTLNLKRYELKDHLGNVRTHFSDILLAKNYVPNAGAPNLSTTFPYNGVEAHQTSLYNYYSFGMPKPNHGTSATNWLDEVGNVSSVGFNGQKREDDIGGVGNHNTAVFWEYDTRTGRRWNLDPKPTIGVSEYATFNNNPISNTDILGDTIGINAFRYTSLKSLVNSLFSHLIEKFKDDVRQNDMRKSADNTIKDKKDDGVFVLMGHGLWQNGGVAFDDPKSTKEEARVNDYESFNLAMSRRSPEWAKSIKEGKKITLILTNCEVAKYKDNLAKSISQNPNITVIASSGSGWWRTGGTFLGFADLQKNENGEEVYVPTNIKTYQNGKLIKSVISSLEDF